MDLVKLVVARLAQAALLLLTLSFLLFGVMAHLPGDPVDLLVASNPELRAEDIARLKKLRGLDQPFPVRWWRWLAGYHEARPPPATRLLPAVIGDQDPDRDFGTARPFAVDVVIDTDELARLGLVARAAHPAEFVDGHLTALVPAGASRLVLVVTDAFGQQAPWIVPVYVAPAVAVGDVVILMPDDSEAQRAGGTEDAPVERSDVERIAAAVAVRPLPELQVPTVEIERLIGQTVVAEDGDLYLAKGSPVPDPDRYVCGVACVVVGDLQGLGWSYATKRPVRELLFGTNAVCGDFNVDAGEGCDDGNVVDNDGCDHDCVVSGSGVINAVDVGVAGWLVGMGRIGNTLVLTVPALLLAMIVSLIFGTWAGWKRGAVDVVVRGFSAVTSSMPAFFVGLLLVTLFAETLRVLPSGGVFSPGIQHEGAVAVGVDRIRHALLPVLVLVLFWSGRFVRQVRSAVIAAATGDYVRTARMKGATTWRVIVGHVLPNAAVPLVTLVGLSLPALFGGALLTETVFAWPGLGRLQYDAILQNDSYVAVVVFLISAAMVLLGSLLADVLVHVLDPRTRGRR